MRLCPLAVPHLNKFAIPCADGCRLHACAGQGNGAAAYRGGGRRVPRQVPLSIRGSSTAYSLLSSSSSSTNWVSGGIWLAVLPHSGVIHHSLQRAHARNLRQLSCTTCTYTLVQTVRNKERRSYVHMLMKDMPVQQVAMHLQWLRAIGFSLCDASEGERVCSAARVSGAAYGSAEALEQAQDNAETQHAWHKSQSAAVHGHIVWRDHARMLSC